MGREAAALAYGKDNPYAREEEYTTIAAVKRDDLVAWHKQYVAPNNIILGVSGDFDPKAMEAKLRQAFESWPKGTLAKDPDVKFVTAEAGILLRAEARREPNFYRDGRSRNSAQQS